MVGRTTRGRRGCSSARVVRTQSAGRATWSTRWSPSARHPAGARNWPCWRRPRRCRAGDVRAQQRFRRSGNAAPGMPRRHHHGMRLDDDSRGSSARRRVFHPLRRDGFSRFVLRCDALRFRGRARFERAFAIRVARAPRSDNGPVCRPGLGRLSRCGLVIWDVRSGSPRGIRAEWIARAISPRAEGGHDAPRPRPPRPAAALHAFCAEHNHERPHEPSTNAGDGYRLSARPAAPAAAGLSGHSRSAASQATLWGAVVRAPPGACLKKSEAGLIALCVRRHPHPAGRQLRWPAPATRDNDETNQRYHVVIFVTMSPVVHCADRGCWPPPRAGRSPPRIRRCSRRRIGR